MNYIWRNFQQKQRNFFDHKNTRFFNFKWIFFHFEKMESQIFQNWQNFYGLNNIGQNFQLNQRNFFGQKKTRFVIFKWIFFQLEKLKSQIIENKQFFSPELYQKKNKN